MLLRRATKESTMLCILVSQRREMGCADGQTVLCDGGKWRVWRVARA